MSADTLPNAGVKSASEVCLFGSARGGTSLVAGIFIEHGFWLGREFMQQTTAVTQKGAHDATKKYRCYENADIKSYLKKHHKLHPATALQHTSGESVIRMRQKFAQYTNGRRLFFKTLVEYYELFDVAFPDLVPVWVKRDFEGAVHGLAKRKGNEQEMRRHVEWRYNYIDEQVAKGNGFLVPSDDVVAGDYSSLVTVFDALGVPFMPSIAQRVLRPDIWTRV